MKFDFCDVGTSDFDTSLSDLKPEQKILLVEPVFSYLKNLPDGKNIFKASFAISDKEGWGKIFYLKPEVIKQYNFPDWIRGCNSLNEKHITVLRLLKECDLPENLISEQEVRVINFARLIYLYEITEIDFLKIDTEGHDHLILKSILEFTKKNKIKINKIKFEFNEAFGNTEELRKIISEFNCELIEFEKDNVIMKLKNEKHQS